MKTRLQLGGWILALALSAGLAVPCVMAQRPRAHFAQQKPSKPPKAQAAPARPQPQAQNNNRPPQQSAKPQGNAAGGGQGGGAKLTPRQQLGVGSPRPWVDQMRSLPPQQRERVLQNSRAFQNMPAEQQNRIRQQFNQWDKMSPQQKTDQQARE